MAAVIPVDLPSSLSRGHAILLPTNISMSRGKLSLTAQLAWLMHSSVVSPKTCLKRSASGTSLHAPQSFGRATIADEISVTHYLGRAPFLPVMPPRNLSTNDRFDRKPSPVGTTVPTHLQRTGLLSEFNLEQAWPSWAYSRSHAVQRPMEIAFVLESTACSLVENLGCVLFGGSFRHLFLLLLKRVNVHPPKKITTPQSQPLLSRACTNFKPVHQQQFKTYPKALNLITLTRTLANPSLNP